jgi:hypothetical protein
MQWFTTGASLGLALAIIAIGTSYVANPVDTTRSFGLPLPEEGPNIPWWLRLKGVRDIAAGMLVLAIMLWGSARDVGLVLLVSAIIPTGDMMLILAARGKTGSALGIHGITAALMVVVGVLTIVGGQTYAA